MKYLFTIIVPVYNVEKYLKKCINSVVNQNIGFENIELILVNDGSIDNSGKICEEFSEKYKNIVYINQSNKGVSYTRNNSMKIAKGKYILFLDSDDYISHNTCKDIYDFYENHYNEVDVVTYPIMQVKKGTVAMHYRYKKFFKNGTSVYDVEKNPYIIQANVNVVIKKDCGVSFNNEMKFVEDEDFVTRLIMKKKKLGFVKSARYYYIKRDDSTNSTIVNDDKILLQTFDNYEKLLNEFHYNKYVQSIFINALRWRIEENSLYPSNNKDVVRNKVIKLLKNIDDELIANYPNMRPSTIFYIFDLKDIKPELELTNRVKIRFNNNLVYNEKNIHMHIFRCYKKNNKLYLSVGLNNVIFKYNEPKVFVKKGNELKEIKLTKNDENYKYYAEANIYTGDIVLDESYKRFSFIVRIDNHDYSGYLTHTANVFNKMIHLGHINTEYNKLFDYLKNSMKCYKHPEKAIDRLKYFNKKIDVCLNYTNIDNSKLSKISNNITNVGSDVKLNSKKHKELFLRSKYLIIEYNNFMYNCPFGNAIRFYRDLVNYELYWVFDGNICYENSKERSIVDYVIVKNKKDKELVKNKLGYYENEIIIIN